MPAAAALADVVEQSVTAPIDQQVNGATDMLYINSVSGDDGSSAITVTFELERDPDLAAVEVVGRDEEGGARGRQPARKTPTSSTPASSR